MKKDLEFVFRELKDDVSSFAELKFELFKLNTYERISKLIAILSYGLLLSSLAFITLLFVMITLGFLFSKWLGSTAAGFGIVVALYLILVVIVVILKDPIRMKVINSIISALVLMDKKKKESSNEQPKDSQSDLCDAEKSKPDESE